MFAQINPAQTSGQSYDAVDRIIIETPANIDPSITLVTTKRITISDETHALSSNNLVENIVSDATNPEGNPVNLNEVFNLVDMTTGITTGSTMTYEELMSVIYSAVVHILSK